MATCEVCGNEYEMAMELTVGRGGGRRRRATTATELRREAAKLGIEGRSKWGKAQLIRSVGQKRRSS
jgi:hypothetical protein